MKLRLKLFLLLLVALASCGRKAPDLSSVLIGKYYVAQDNDRDVVLCVEEVTGKSIKGRWYLENGSLAKPHPFMAESGFWHKNTMKSDSLVVKANAMPGGDTLVLEILLDKSWHTLRFMPWQQPPVMDLQNSWLYHDSLFGVTVDTNVVYAQAKGYWTSYPEPEVDCDDYLSILMKKWTDKEEMTLKDDLELKMDIYSPDTRDSLPRPLLMLIHGGAFFNGDKQDAGYQEWGRYFASRGYVVASINYRLGFKARGAKRVDRAGYRALQDARAAMSFLLRHPERYPIDPDRLFVAGTSAGGITALNLAFMTNDDIPKSAEAGPVNKIYNDVSDFFKNGSNENENHKEVGLEDLGGINAVAKNNGGSVDFHINAVVNMWGAVHKIDMLGRSKSTAILSFHGDADGVVAYDYGFPFSKILSKIDADPVKQLIINEMYGSKCIHDWASTNGMKSELHTKKGGGHSLHADCSELTDYYTLITDTTTRFLYQRIFPSLVLNKSFVGRQQWFELDGAGELMSCGWEALGGLVLEAEPDRARVMFFADAPKHQLGIRGQEKDGRGYYETYPIQ